jgi:hypothetical protein
MEYPANILDPTKSSNEKFSFEDEEIPTRTTSDVARFISEKLLYWGVEERGAYLYLHFRRSALK